MMAALVIGNAEGIEKLVEAMFAPEEETAEDGSPLSQEERERRRRLKQEADMVIL